MASAAARGITPADAAARASAASKSSIRATLASGAKTSRSASVEKAGSIIVIALLQHARRGIICRASDALHVEENSLARTLQHHFPCVFACLLYTSDAADDL